MVVNKGCKLCKVCSSYRHTIRRCGRYQYICSATFPIPKGRINSKKFKYKLIWQ